MRLFPSLEVAHALGKFPSDSHHPDLSLEHMLGPVRSEFPARRADSEGNLRDEAGTTASRTNPPKNQATALGANLPIDASAKRRMLSFEDVQASCTSCTWLLTLEPLSENPCRPPMIQVEQKTLVPCGRDESRTQQVWTLTCTKITAVGMMEDQRADAGFRIHHEAFGELNADFFGPQELPDAGLILQVGASRITEAVALAAIARSQALRHGHLGRVGEAPVLTDAAVQPFGAALCRFNGQSLQAVTQEIVAFVLGLLRTLANSFAGRHDEEREMVALAVFGRQNIIAKAQEVALALP